MDLESQLKEAVALHFPGRDVKGIYDWGAWVRQIVDVTLDNDERVLFKISLQRTVSLWKTNLDYLNAHTPSLVHMSAFPWTLYLERESHRWQIAKLLSVGDFLWWDAAFDVACLRYPPFGEMKPAWWTGFLAGYGEEPERKRLLLYAVMQRLCAVMGCYMEPEAPGNEAWREHAFDDLSDMLDEFESLT